MYLSCKYTLKLHWPTTTFVCFIQPSCYKCSQDTNLQLPLKLHITTSNIQNVKQKINLAIKQARDDAEFNWLWNCKEWSMTHQPFYNRSLSNTSQNLKDSSTSRDMFKQFTKRKIKIYQRVSDDGNSLGLISYDLILSIFGRNC